MMTKLFSSSDQSSIVFSMNWMSYFLGLTLIPLNFWCIPNRFFIINYKILFNLHKEIKILTELNMGTLIFISMFYFILFNNFMGLFPYFFTSSSHLVFSLSMALPSWIFFMIYGWFNNTMLMLAHSVPQGTPPISMPFLVWIETISNINRPGTLAVRLSANMIAGHLLMTLLGNTGPLLNVLLTLLIMSQILLIILEMAVAMIQSYVFAILSSLHSSQVNNE